MIHLLGFHEAKTREGFFDYSISINDADQPKATEWRVHGKIDTLKLSFNDVWLDDEGHQMIWANNGAVRIIGGKLTEPKVLDDVEAFHKKHPDLLSFNRETLIHCWAGVSRSSSVLLFLLLLEGQSFDDALNYIMAVRPFARPNLILVEEMGKRFKDDSFLPKIKKRLDYSVLN